MTTTDFSQKLNNLELFLYNFALRLTQNTDKAKDLFQDTSLRAFRYREKFQVGTNFKGWIATIMRNTFVTNYRKAKRFQTVSEPIENLAYAIESKTMISNKGEVNLRMAEIQKMFDQIGDIYAIPFMMHYQGYHYKEISEHLNTPIGTIKSRIFMARKKLKTLIVNRELN